MAKGGSDNTTVTQTNLPEYVEPYFNKLLQNAESESRRDYETYDGQRLADGNSFTDASRANVAGMAVNPVYGDAANLTNNAITGLQGQGPQFSEYGFDPVSDFRTEVGSYMSPYMQNVVDVQKAQAGLDFDRAQGGRDAAAVQAGAFGGSRGAVVDALAQEDLQRRLMEIQATGQQNAFESGSAAFENQRGVEMQRQMEKAGELGRTQAGNAEYGLNSIDLQGRLAEQMTGFGDQQFNQQASIAQFQDQTGRDVRAEQQAGLDIGYEDFLRQQAYPMETLGQYSSILHGIPVTPDQTITQNAYSNPVQEALGTGLSALGTYNYMKA